MAGLSLGGLGHNQFGTGLGRLFLVQFGCGWFLHVAIVSLFLCFGIQGCSLVVPLKKGSNIPCCWSFLEVSTIVCSISMGSSSSRFSSHCLMLSILLSSSGSSPSLESSWMGGVSAL